MPLEIKLGLREWPIGLTDMRVNRVIARGGSDGEGEKNYRILPPPGAHSWLHVRFLRKRRGSRRRRRSAAAR